MWQLETIQNFAKNMAILIRMSSTFLLKMFFFAKYVLNSVSCIKSGERLQSKTL